MGTWSLAACVSLAVALAAFPGTAAAVTTTTEDLWDLDSAWTLGVNVINEPSALGNTIVIIIDNAVPPSGNTLTFDSVDIDGMSVAAGGSFSGPSNNNILKIDLAAGSETGSSTIGKYAVGGVSGGTPTIVATATGNHVDILATANGYQLTEGIIGGMANPDPTGRALVQNNVVTFMEGSVMGSGTVERIMGGLITGGGTLAAVGDANGNEVVFENDSSASVSHLIGAHVDGAASAANVVAISVTSNKVTVNGVDGTLDVTDSVYGAYVDKGTAATAGAILLQGNSVTLYRGEVASHVVGAYAGELIGATFSGNSVTLYGTTLTTHILDDVMGAGTRDNATSIGHTATGNFADISGGKMDANVYGAKLQGGTANSNYVTLKGGEIANDVIGGYIVAGTGTATGNHVTVNTAASEVKAGSLYGASTDNGAVTGNWVDVSVSGGHDLALLENIEGAVVEGATGAKATGNNVIINIAEGKLANDGSSSDGLILGARVASDGDVQDNFVRINITNANGEMDFNGDIVGASVNGDGNALYSANVAAVYINVGSGTLSVTDDNTTDFGNIIGAMVDGNGSSTGAGVVLRVGSGTLSVETDTFAAMLDGTGAATGNYIDLEIGDNGTFGNGGDLHAANLGNSSNTGIAKDNSVRIKVGGGTGAVALGTQVQGASVAGSGNAEGNSVTIFCADLADCKMATAGGVTGGRTTGGTAIKNEVRLLGGVIVSADVAGGGSQNGSAQDNSIWVSGNTQLSGNVSGAYAGTSATTNHVYIENLTTATSADIRGGFSLAGTGGSANQNSVFIRNSKISGNVYGGAATDTSGGTTTGNTVTLSGDLDLTGAASSALAGGNVTGANGFTGNTLVLDNVKQTGGFQTASAFENYDITVSIERALEAVTDPTNSPIVPAGTTTFGQGTTHSKAKVTITGGPTRLQTGDVLSFGGTSANTTDLDITEMCQQLTCYVVSDVTNGIQIDGITLVDEAKALSELPLADISFVNRGSDLIASQAIPTALASVAGNVGVAAFAAIGYGWSRTETGSHIDVQGMSGDVGLAVGTETSAGPFVAGAFVEFGDGSFDSYNTFSRVANFQGEGDLSYFGGGVFARLDVGQRDASRPYFEASLRFGKTNAEFKTRDFSFAAGRELSYDLDAKYWGFHAGAGYIIDFSSFNGSLDLSAKYFHTHRDGDEFRVNGDPATLSSVTSSRVQVGGRLTGGLTETIKGYFGLYFEHEFNGDSHVTYLGTNLPEVTLGGSSGIGELGLIVNAPGSPLEVQMGVQGSAGRRDSISANLSIRYTF
ncbi:MAG: autotransporter outer membrane beta-barrel domain-containing protein [Deltaproteobacteria bacterium]|jgi:hypothetical protein|nr:autotransporter outer membrane beta-barrel domain-containing protein [Deltaproteobacteria bacterium]